MVAARARGRQRVVPARRRRGRDQGAVSGSSPEAPVVLCVSRMVPRKGQDTLIRVWPRVLAGLRERPVPAVTAPAEAARGRRRLRPRAAPVLLLVGDGPYARDLRELARRQQVADSVIFTGPVPWEDLPAYYDAGHDLRHAVPDQAGRPGRRGPRHRLPGGLGDRAAGDRRRLWRGAGRDPARRDRLRGRRPRRCRARGPAGPAARRPAGRGRPWARRASPGSTGSGAGTSSPPGSGRSWPADCRASRGL